MLAAYAGRANICRQLLMAKTDKNLKSNENKTASIYAKEGGHYHIAEMIDRFIHPSTRASFSYDEENVRKRETRMSRLSRHSHYFGNNDSRRISTASKLKSEMLPRKDNTWWVYVSW